MQDVNRQTWAGQTSLLVHPSSLYVGIKTPRTFVQKGDKIDVDSIVTDLDGNFVAGRDVEIKAVLKDWQFDKGTWAEKTIDEQTCNVKSLSESGRRRRRAANLRSQMFIRRQTRRPLHDHRDGNGRPRALQPERNDRLGSRRKDSAKTKCRTGSRFRSSRVKRNMRRVKRPSCW